MGQNDLADRMAWCRRTRRFPPSLYLSGKPAWFGSRQWPAVGRDVASGDVTSGSGGESTLDGHAHKIPARDCYEGASPDTASRLTAPDFSRSSSIPRRAMAHELVSARPTRGGSPMRLDRLFV